MKTFVLAAWSVVALLSLALTGAAQQHQPTSPPREEAAEDPAAAQRGQALFRSTCGFCHGEDATGARAPDLVRSVIVNHDERGNLLGPVIRNGRPDKGMPSFATLTDAQVADIVAFLHRQAYEALHSGHVSGDYPAAKLLTGNAEAGKEFFYGPGNCSHCHSVTGDLAGIATKMKPIDLQQHMIYPSRKEIPKTATVTLRDGTRYEGKLAHKDEFEIALVCRDGWYRSWPLNDVKAEIHDPLAAHRELTAKYTDRDIHDLFAYLETLK
jgi:cytochrome c oxidase cbb3-type subunit 3